MIDETREQDLVGKYFGPNRSPDDRTMKQACERLRSEAHAEGVKEGYNQAIDDVLKIIRVRPGHFETCADQIDIMKELEKLRDETIA